MARDNNLHPNSQVAIDLINKADINFHPHGLLLNDCRSILRDTGLHTVCYDHLKELGWTDSKERNLLFHRI